MDRPPEMRRPGARVPLLADEVVLRSAAQADAEHDERVTVGLLRVTNLMDPPSALMRPAVAVRVALAVLAHRVARSRAGHLSGTEPAR